MDTIILNIEIIPNLDNLFTIYPNYESYILMPGEYHITRDLVINKPNIKLIGKTHDYNHVVIYQDDPERNSLVLDADNIVIRNISIYNKIGNGTCLTVQDANYSIIENCHFYGNINDFTIYYAGPSNLIAGQPVLDAYQTNKLCKFNTFANNCIYTEWTGDAISYSLQSNGIFSNNIVRGGKIAIYMCKNTCVTGNYVYDSTSNGIFISLPSHNVYVDNNKIMNPLYSGIVVRNQVEHGIFDNKLNKITIKNNIINNAKFHGIEINNLDTSDLSNNIIYFVSNYGIYSLKSSNLNITQNDIYGANKGLYLDNTTNTKINNNGIYSIFLRKTSDAIYIYESNDNVITGNTGYGDFTSVIINNVQGTNIIDNNNSEINNEFKLINSTIVKFNNI